MIGPTARHRPFTWDQALVCAVATVGCQGWHVIWFWASIGVVHVASSIALFFAYRYAGDEMWWSPEDDEALHAWDRRHRLQGPELSS